ncbi:hypothetical protein E2C01_056818 [Portunus trituberculatus]|uniref:Uncharacterized protein n=1 Tax=Portunus trituberculatus TaxID=210409 RepID=A0A5B7H0L7_PORTR|nr:hypothetical protein [Portunus trituberculatus]
MSIFCTSLTLLIPITSPGPSSLHSSAPKVFPTLEDALLCSEVLVLTGSHTCCLTLVPITLGAVGDISHHQPHPQNHQHLTLTTPLPPSYLTNIRLVFKLER